MRFALLSGPRDLRLRCALAETPRERRRGLIGRAELACDEALLFPNATSVHTFGVRFALLVARLDRDLRVVDVRPMSPRRVLAPSRRSRHVLECCAAADVRIGDRLVLRSGPVAQARIARISP